ncbi:MAG TPA: FHA domain-containing protein [Candidatus Baltobacteraceae bacterium]|nr:FHA domain-containing protein [Candidatus Baltobacteraceae bacterium]
MTQLNVLSGKKAGSQMVVRRFPFRIGRAAQNDLSLEDDGVWDSHLTLELNRENKRIILAVAPNAFAAVNNQAVQSAPLRNGDVISFGSVKIQFWLATVKQRGLRLRELFVWMLLIAVTAAQFFLIYWLLR